MRRFGVMLAFVLGMTLAVQVNAAQPQSTDVNALDAAKRSDSMLIDPEDGMLDVSEILSTAKGFMPVPLLITEPALGVGGGLILLFLHDSIDNRAELMAEKNPDGTRTRVPPPSISGVGGFGTENGSWGAFGFHMGIWNDDAVRYLGAFGHASMNYDYYGVEDRAAPINLEGSFLIQQVMLRLGESDFFAGVNFQLTSSTVALDDDIDLPFPISQDIESQSAGMSGLLEYDTRDNIFTPDKGFNCKASWTYYDDWLGSDNRFDIYYLKNRGWYPLLETVVAGFRVDGEFSDGDVPFYMSPFVKLRGIPAMRYQGDYTLTSEAELRWDFHPRWSAVAFGGAGWTANDSVSNIGSSDTYPAGGIGFRYLVARLFNIRAGIDYGVSEVGEGVYITMGTAWQ
jgi:hypothetical protein